MKRNSQHKIQQHTLMQESPPQSQQKNQIQIAMAKTVFILKSSYRIKMLCHHLNTNLAITRSN